MFNIAVLPGDGIGAEVTLAVMPLFDILKLPFRLKVGDLGWHFWETEGNPLPQRTWDLIYQSDATLLGAATSKPILDKHYVSPILSLRRSLDLFANVRPCFKVKPNSPAFNFCIIRENTEGLYSGFDYYPTPQVMLDAFQTDPNWTHTQADEISMSLRVQSKKGLQRIFRFAFNYAKKKQFKRVTLADKPNVLRYSSAFARDLFEKEASLYPEMDAEILNVDAVGLWLVTKPNRFGVIVCENMFGDILSDVGAGVMGGLGFAPSANIGDHHAYFEPVHGSGLSMEKNRANPIAMFLTCCLLLEHFNFTDAALNIKKAIHLVLQEKRKTTYDLGGQATTKELATAILERLDREPHHE